MACIHPLKGYRGLHIGKSGKRPIVFNPSQGFRDLPVSVPCGQCRFCRLEKSRQWAIRCAHEASLNVANSFITLTYSNAHLPPDGSLNLRHFQLFMKRLRKRLGPVRFFHCGEYGALNLRPHYHACLFGLEFEDKILHKIDKKTKIPLYKSEILSELWPFGFSTIGDVTFESAAYCARYITKKITGPPAEAHYQNIDQETGEIHQLKPEYTTMSRRPGIGRAWFDKYKSDLYPDDFIILRGKKMKPQNITTP